MQGGSIEGNGASFGRGTTPVYMKKLFLPASQSPGSIESYYSYDLTRRLGGEGIRFNFPLYVWLCAKYQFNA